ncbi:MAG: class I SAM-dependent methyltransferase [Ktedonobacteraceae bacterium]
MNDNESKTTISDLYNRVAPVYGQVGPDPFGYAGQRLIECLGITEEAQVLDAGVGRGANLFPAAVNVGPRGQVIGIDLAENMLRETAREIQRRNIVQASVLQMDAEHLAFDSASFDDVLCGFAIFLFPHLEQALAEFFRVLRVGGKLGITMAHNPDTISQWYGKHLTEYYERHHFPLNAGGNTLDHSELPSYLTRTGFVDVQVRNAQAEFVYADAQQWWDAKWTHGTRYSLEHMAPQVLAQFKREVFARLQEAQQPDGIHEEWDIQFTLGTKNTQEKEDERG